MQYYSILNAMKNVITNESIVCYLSSGKGRAAVDGRAARGVTHCHRFDFSGVRGHTAGHHHLLAEELGDALEVRGLAAAGAGAAELEQGLCELAVLDVGFLVDEVVLVGDALLGVVPVGGLVELAKKFLMIQYLRKALINIHQHLYLDFYQPMTQCYRKVLLQ